MGAPETASPLEPGTVLAQDEASRVIELPGRIFVLDVFGHLDHAVMKRALDVIWASPQWRQPWGFVVVLHDSVTYDADMRQHEMPPKDVRAVGTAVVSSKQLYRMVVNSVGLGYRMVQRFALSAHANLDEAIEVQRSLVEQIEAAGRPY